MPEDTGDSRYALPIWVGRYEVEPASGVTLTSATAMLSKDNTVQLCGDAEGVTAGATFATVPEDLRPGADVVLYVVVSGTSSKGSITGSGTVTIPERTLTGTAEVTEGARELSGTAEVSEPGRTLSGTATVTEPERELEADVSLSEPQRTLAGTASVDAPARTLTGTAAVTVPAPDEPQLVAFGDIDADGNVTAASVARVLSNVHDDTVIDGTAQVSEPERELSGTVSVSEPSRTLTGTASVNEPQRQLNGTTSVEATARTLDGTVTVSAPQRELSGTASVSEPEQVIPVSVTAEVDIPVVAVLTIGTDGSMVCSESGTVHLNGFSYHINDRYY